MILRTHQRLVASSIVLTIAASGCGADDAFLPTKAETNSVLVGRTTRLSPLEAFSRSDGRPFARVKLEPVGDTETVVAFMEASLDTLELAPGLIPEEPEVGLCSWRRLPAPAQTFVIDASGATSPAETIPERLTDFRRATHECPCATLADRFDLRVDDDVVAFGRIDEHTAVVTSGLKTYVLDTSSHPPIVVETEGPFAAEQIHSIGFDVDGIAYAGTSLGRVWRGRFDTMEFTEVPGVSIGRAIWHVSVPPWPNPEELLISTGGNLTRQVSGRVLHAELGVNSATVSEWRPERPLTIRRGNAGFVWLGPGEAVGQARDGEPFQYFRNGFVRDVNRWPGAEAVEAIALPGIDAAFLVSEIERSLLVRFEPASMEVSVLPIELRAESRVTAALDQVVVVADRAGFSIQIAPRNPVQDDFGACPPWVDLVDRSRRARDVVLTRDSVLVLSSTSGFGTQDLQLSVWRFVRD